MIFLQWPSGESMLMWQGRSVYVRTEKRRVCQFLYVYFTCLIESLASIHI